MIDRRTLLGSIAALPLAASAPCAQERRTPPAPAAIGALIERPIPGANDQVPVIGVGTARRYADPAEADLPELRDFFEP